MPTSKFKKLKLIMLLSCCNKIILIISFQMVNRVHLIIQVLTSKKKKNGEIDHLALNNMEVPENNCYIIKFTVFYLSHHQFCIHTTILKHRNNIKCGEGPHFAFASSSLHFTGQSPARRWKKKKIKTTAIFTCEINFDITVNYAVSSLKAVTSPHFP